jgi:hypothetical protein
MPSTDFNPGDSFRCRIFVDNCDVDIGNFPLFMILNIGNEYLFAPEFSSRLDYYLSDYPIGRTEITVIEEFPWPAGAGSGHAAWYAGFTTKDFQHLLLDFDYLEFTWTE